MPSVSFRVFGGVNFADEPTFLLQRSHQYANEAWIPRVGNNGHYIVMDAAGGHDFDLERENLISRRGSTSYKNLTTTLDGTATTVDQDSNSGTDVLYVAATTGLKVNGSIIVNRGGAREETAVIASISAGVSVTLTANLTNTHTAVQADAVEQYVFLSGDQVVLHKELRLASVGTLAQYVVSKYSIYTDQSGTWAQINDSTGALYTHTTQSVAKASIIALDGGVFFGTDGTNNKIQRHISGTNLQPEMDNGNSYTDAGGTGQTITGTWGTAYYHLESLNGRLIFNDGTSTIEYTDTNQPFDLAGGGNFPASAAVSGLKVHVPQFGDSLSAILYIGTAIGWEFTSNLASANTIQGSPAPMKNSMVVSTRNWIVYMAIDGGIHALNGNRVIDLGRRFKALDGTTGPLDMLWASGLVNTRTVGSAGYNHLAEQVWFLISTAASGDPDTTLVIDFQRGEPYLDEPRESFEQHVRCLHWTGQDYYSITGTNDGFIGARKSGTLWYLNSGNSDYAATAIDIAWLSPMVDAAAPINEKNLLTFTGRALRAGSWNVQLDYLLERDTASSKSIQFNQGAAASAYGTATYGTATYASDGLAASASDIDLICEIFQIKVTMAVADQSFRITNFEQRFNILAEQR